MKILSHRGFWKEESEKNTMEAFIRSFDHQFGLETDIRDFRETLVISHDPPRSEVLKLRELLEAYSKAGGSFTLALNIKADGLQRLLREKLDQYKIADYFVFDMSIPETRQYLINGFKVFTRQSEFEHQPLFYEEVTGIWLDCFLNDWVEEKTIVEHLRHKKKVCLVSPELHKRSYQTFWDKLANMSVVQDDNLMLCTDIPTNARDFFNVKN